MSVPDLRAAVIAGGSQRQHRRRGARAGRGCGFPARQAALLDGRLSCAAEDC